MRSALLPFLFFFSVASAQTLIVVDPGHGGHDPGAVGCGLEEATVVLDISTRLRDELQGAGLRVALTRTNDTFVGLVARAAYANERNADYFVSIHTNSFGDASANGTETWTANNVGNTTLSLARHLQDAMLSAWGRRDRGLKQSNFTVLTETDMSAALCETAFISNCGGDADFLASGTRRAELADSLMRGIAAFVGVNPGDPDPPDPQTGAIRGVVFQDVGAGTDDMTRRIGGAVVRVRETGAQVAAAADGAWAFTLNVGEYTIEASRPGYIAESKRCAVTAGGTTWCSIGLVVEPPEPDPDAAVPEPDAFVPDPDAFVPPQPDPDAFVPPQPDPDAFVPPQPDPDAGRDAETWDAYRPDFGGWPELDGGEAEKGATPSEVRSTGGCQSSPLEPSGLGWLVLLASAGLLRRRLAVLAVLGFSVGAAQAWTLNDERLVSRDLPRIVNAPRVSPDGTLVAAEGADGLWVYPVKGAAAWPVALGRRASHEPVWHTHSRAISYRSPEQSGTALPALACALDGRAVKPERLAKVAAFIQEDEVWLFGDGAPRRISPHDDRYVTARTSADGQHVVFWGLTTGLRLYEVGQGKLTELGAGSHPSFSPDGRLLVFERTTDDGEQLLSSELYLVDLTQKSPAAERLTNTPSRLERMPSLSGEGQLAFVVGQDLFIAHLRR